MNAIWLIVIMILWLATLGLLYVTNADVARLEDEANTARTDKLAADSRFDERSDEYRALSNLVGFNDGSGINFSDDAAIQTQIDSVKTLLGPVVGGEDSDATLEQSVTALVGAFQAANTAKAAAESGFAQEQAARAAAEQKVNDVEKQYRDQMSSLRQELEAEQARADQQAQDDQGRIAQLRQAQEDADAAARSAQTDLQEFQREANQAAATAEATIQSLAMRRLPKEPEAPDGAILAVSDSLVTAWIDLGGRHGLRRGTRFEVLRPGKAGELEHRGEVEVQEVESSMALVRVLGDVSAYDPILEGDLVRNPHFEKGKRLSFYLLGEFPLTLSKEFVSQRLGELGAEVDTTIDTGTDVLVLGEKNLADEFAPELTATDEYILAEKLGLRIMRLDDLAGYLRY